MYNQIGVGAGAGAVAAGSLATTGSSVFWMVLAGFAMVAVGTAIMRIVPRRAHVK